MTSPHRLAPGPGEPPGVRPLILWTAIPAMLAGLLLGLHLIKPFARPAQTVQKALEALAAGDAARLRNEERLGFQRRAEREIKRRGETEYARVLAIFDKEAQLGDREYRRIRRIIAQLGERDFRKLSKDDQRTLRESSHRQFVIEKGWPMLADDEQKLLGSAEVIGDRTKLRARAIAVGLPTLSEDAQNAAEGNDMASPDSAKDKKLGKIAAQAEKAGYVELSPALQSAESAAAMELVKMNRHDREMVENGSYNRWVLEAGLKATDDKTRAKANIAQLLDDDAPEAWALRRSFGFKDLDADSRKQIEGLDHDVFVAARRVFIDLQGMRLWGEKLRETFNPGCCATTTVRYLGESGRSLRRNNNATVALEFGPTPPKPKKDKNHPTVDDDTDNTHPAKRYLGQTAMLEYRWGSWAIHGFDASSEEDEPAKRPAVEDAMKALSGMGGSGAGFMLFGALGLVVLLVVFLKRKTPAVRPIELAVGGIVLGLAALQIALQGQCTVDDLWFTPLYMALPIWVGVRRGAESGFVAGFLGGLALLVASAVAGVPSWAASAGDGLALGEHLLAALMLAATGALAGRLRWPSGLPSALPLLWILFFAVVDRSQLASLTMYAHVLLGCTMTGLGLLIYRLDLWTPVTRIWQSDEVSG